MKKIMIALAMAASLTACDPAVTPSPEPSLQRGRQHPVPTQCQQEGTPLPSACALTGLPPCEHEDGPGPCLWTDPDTGRVYYVTGDEYRR